MQRRSPGEGSIYQRKDGRWQGSLQVYGTRKTVYGKTRSEVAKKLGGLQDTAKRNHGLPSTNLTLAEYLEDWLDQAEPRLRLSTWTRYEYAIRLHIVPALGNTKLTKITPLQLTRTYSAMNKTTGTRTIQMSHLILHKVLSDAVKWGLIASNPADQVECPRHQQKKKTLWNPEQIQQFIGALIAGKGGHYGNILIFLLASGCRIGEALGLRIGDIDLVRNTIHIERQIIELKGKFIEDTPKTATSIRTITLPSFGIEAIKRQIKESPSNNADSRIGWTPLSRQFEAGF